MPPQPRDRKQMSGKETSDCVKTTCQTTQHIYSTQHWFSWNIKSEVRCNLLNRKVLADTRASRALHSACRSGKLQHTQPHVRMSRAPENPPVRLGRYKIETEYSRDAMQNRASLESPSRLERAHDPGEQRDRKNSN
jgi:hypothetical protein